ncbi:hypothetical protein ACFV9C_42750 [Kribbella sp. NPDC059898]|uniref:hypothetical protein n=1 Tax=Kribbella sp. NPDC059898 TaxID=3346995 RepID=UPI00364C24CE
MTDWTAVVDWTYPITPNTAQLDEWLGQLEGLSAAIHDEPAEDLGRDKVRCSATISFEAATLRQAAAEAIRLIESATGAKASGVNVVTTREFRRRLTEPQFPRMVSYTQIGQKLGVSRQRAREIATTVKGFPAAAIEGPNGPLYVEELVDAFGARWDRKVGRPSVDTMSTPASSHSPTTGE